MAEKSPSFQHIVYINLIFRSSQYKFFGGDAFLKKGFHTLRLGAFAFPATVLLLSTALFLPVLRTEKPDALAEKIVYLTFDDGPSEVTDEILEILSEEGIKATFFVIGPSGEKTDERLMRIVSEGHSIGLHTMSHDYEKIYRSAESFLRDIRLESSWVYSVTGIESGIFRFPGGSSNSTVGPELMDEIKSAAEKAGLRWFDWNSDGRDSLGELLSPEEIAGNVLSSEALGSDCVIVLLHDSSTVKTTPAALKIIIKEFRRLGYSFASLG